jgi:hypothetical protein
MLSLFATQRNETLVQCFHLQAGFEALELLADKIFIRRYLYHAGKWGIEGFIDAVGQVVAPFNIGVRIVEPGGARTAFRFGSSKLGPKMDVYSDNPASMTRPILQDTSRLPPRRSCQDHDRQRPDLVRNETCLASRRPSPADQIVALISSPGPGQGKLWICSIGSRQTERRIHTRRASETLLSVQFFTNRLWTPIKDKHCSLKP